MKKILWLCLFALLANIFHAQVPTDWNSINNSAGELVGAINVAAMQAKAMKELNKKKSLDEAGRAFVYLNDAQTLDSAVTLSLSSIQAYPKYANGYLTSAMAYSLKGDALNAKRMLTMYERNRKRYRMWDFPHPFPTDLVEKVKIRINGHYSELTNESIKQQVSQEPWKNWTLRFFVNGSFGPGMFYSDYPDYDYNGDNLQVAIQAGIRYERLIWLNQANRHPMFNGNRTGINLDFRVQAAKDFTLGEHINPQNLQFNFSPGLFLGKAYLAPISFRYAYTGRRGLMPENAMLPFDYYNGFRVYLNPEIRLYTSKRMYNIMTLNKYRFLKPRNFIYPDFYVGFKFHNEKLSGYSPVYGAWTNKMQGIDFVWGCSYFNMFYGVGKYEHQEVNGINIPFSNTNIFFRAGFSFFFGRY